MFNWNLENIILKGASNASKSPTEKTFAKCERINWFLYKSDYLISSKSWKNISPRFKKEILEGLVRYILINTDYVAIMQVESMAIQRRMRLAS